MTKNTKGQKRKEKRQEKPADEQSEREYKNKAQQKTAVGEIHHTRGR